MPLAVMAFQGRLVAGVGKALRIYDIGKKKLLRKVENKVWEYIVFGRALLTVLFPHRHSHLPSSRLVRKVRESSSGTCKNPYFMLFTNLPKTGFSSSPTTHSQDGSLP